MDVFHVDIHHFGKFVDGCYQDGDVNHWECDAERWGYFEVIEIVKEMGFKEIDSIWYEASGVTKELVNDRGAMEMVSWSKSNGTVHMYLVHQVSEPTYLAQIDFEPAAQPAEAVVQPQTPTNPTENETQARVHEPEVPRPQSEPVADVEDEGNESDQSVKRIRFNDSDDEVGENDGFEQPANLDANTLGAEENVEPSVGKKRKKKGSGKKKGRPKKTTVEADANVDEHFVIPESDEDDISIGNKGKSKVRRCDRGLSDDEYMSEELESASDESASDGECARVKYPSFVMPKRMDDYKWELGCLFSTVEKFRDAAVTYAIHNGRDLVYIKNDQKRVRIRCKEGCPWFIYCGKLSNEDTWQVRKLVDRHTCNREYNVKMMNSKWLGKNYIQL